MTTPTNIECVRQVLQKAKADVEKGWVKTCFARDTSGKAVLYTEPNAVSYDIYGAIMKESAELNGAQQKILMETMEKVLLTKYPSYTTYIAVNDIHCETIQDVIDVFSNLIDSLPNLGVDGPNEKDFSKVTSNLK